VFRIVWLTGIQVLFSGSAVSFVAAMSERVPRSAIRAGSWQPTGACWRFRSDSIHAVGRLGSCEDGGSRSMRQLYFIRGLSSAVSLDCAIPAHFRNEFPFFGLHRW